MVKYVARYADPELYELVSQLRSELSEQNKEMRLLQAKNERLQAEVDLMRRMDEPTLVALQQKDAEIVRLHSALEYKEAWAEDEARVRERQAMAEIARLRGHIELLLESDGKAQAEIERLRMELTKVGSGSYNPALVLAERDAEIERLRDARRELVVALHTLASHFENALYAFRDDDEARKKAEGDIAWAMEIARRHNHNGNRQ